jgi:hypothetical protein
VSDANAPLKSLICSMNDSLMILAPRQWSAVDLTVVRAGDGLKVSELSTRGEGSATPKDRARLHLNLQDEAGHLSDGLTELSQALGAQKWQPGTVRVERAVDFVDWKLLRDDGSTAWFNRLTRGELDSLLVTDALLDLVTGTSKAFDALQEQLGLRLGAVTGFSFDTGQSVLHLNRPEGRALALKAQLLGAYLTEAASWVWGWSDPHANPLAVEQPRSVCAPDAQQPGLSALWRPNYFCDEGFAWTVAGSVAVSIAARGLFRGELPDGSGAALFAVMELP